MNFGIEEHYSIISSEVSDAVFTAKFVPDQYEASQDCIVLGLFVIYKVHNNSKSPTFSANSTDLLTKPALKNLITTWFNMVRLFTGAQLLKDS